MAKIILTIGGSDTWGGGGITTDIKTIEYAGMFALNVLTCIATQGDDEPFEIHVLPPHLVEKQLQTIKNSYRLDGIKIGLLNDIDTIKIVKRFIQTQNCPIIVDPVMAFKETTKEISDYRHALIELMKYADVSTPNLSEAMILSKMSDLSDVESVKQCARTIFAETGTPILIKGGQRLKGNDALDVLYDGHTDQLFSLPKVESTTINGAGCALASMITCQLVEQYSLAEAIIISKKIIRDGIENGIRQSFDDSGNIWNKRVELINERKFDC